MIPLQWVKTNQASSMRCIHVRLRIKRHGSFPAPSRGEQHSIAVTRFIAKRRYTTAAAQSSGWMAIHSMCKCMTSSPNFFLISYKWPVPSTKSFLDSTGFCGILHLILKPKPLRILIHFYPGSADYSRSQAKCRSSIQVKPHSSSPHPVSLLDTMSAWLWPLWSVTGSFSCWSKKSSSHSC